MTAEETLKIAGIIDEVNAAMLENILTEENDAFVFFYDKSDPEAHTVLEELEQIDEKLDKQAGHLRLCHCTLVIDFEFWFCTCFKGQGIAH